MKRLSSFLSNVPQILRNTKQNISEVVEFVQVQDQFYLNLKNHNDIKITELLKSNSDEKILQGLKFLIGVIH